MPLIIMVIVPVTLVAIAGTMLDRFLTATVNTT